MMTDRRTSLLAERAEALDICCELKGELERLEEESSAATDEKTALLKRRSLYLGRVSEIDTELDS